MGKACGSSACGWRNRLFMNSKQKSEIKLLCGVWWHWRMRLGIAIVHEAQTLALAFSVFLSDAKNGVENTDL